MMTRTSTLNRVDRVLLGLGLVIPVWLTIGVGLTALAYPGYSHVDHALSRLRHRCAYPGLFRLDQ